MTSAHLKTLLSPPDLNLSETRVLEYLDSNFSSWESLGALSQLDTEAERIKVESIELQKQVRQGFLTYILALTWHLVVGGVSISDGWIHCRCNSTDSELFGVCTRSVAEEASFGGRDIRVTRGATSCERIEGQAFPSG